jgi:hypothetical protein
VFGLFFGGTSVRTSCWRFKVSAVSGVHKDFDGFFSGRAVPKLALPGRYARAVLDPLGAPFHDRLGINPYTLDEAGVDGLLADG